MSGGAAGPDAWFRGASLRTRLHVAIRRATLPVDDVVALLPVDGRILDWGSGHGLVALRAAVASPTRTVHGVEVDERKVQQARRAAASSPASDRVTFEVVGSEAVPTGTWAGVAIVDVLYLLDPHRQEALVRQAARSVAAGGAVVVKETAPRPAWKRRLSRLQEQVAVRVLQVSRSAAGPRAVAEPGVVAAWLAEEGLGVAIHPLDRGYHVPHVAVVGHRPSS